MAEVFALEKLFNDVTDRFDDESTDIPNVFGWREPAKRGYQQNRICWVPGDPSGSAGEVVGAKYPGGNPRGIGTFEELFHVFIEGVDNSDPENEMAQYRAARLSFDAWYRAVYYSLRHLVKVKSTSWEVDRKTRRRGATIVAVCTVEAKIPDSAYTNAAPVEAVADMQLDSDGDVDTPNTSEDLDVPELEES